MVMDHITNEPADDRQGLSIQIVIVVVVLDSAEL
jgi:hypothetical protein